MCSIHIYQNLTKLSWVSSVCSKVQSIVVVSNFNLQEIPDIFSFVPLLGENLRWLVMDELVEFEKLPVEGFI